MSGKHSAPLGSAGILPAWGGRDARAPRRRGERLQLWLVSKLRLGNPYLANSCLAVLREAGASKTPFPSSSLGTSKKVLL